MAQTEEGLLGMSKIRVRVGDVELEYEGPHTFVIENLASFLQEVIAVGAGREKPPSPPGSSEDDKTDPKPLTGTTSALAHRLKVNSGPELVVAAAAKIAFVDGDEPFHRKTLLREMKSASNHYKTSYSSNLSKMLASLQSSGRLVENGKDTFALGPTESQRLRAQLVD